jgi:hypothetical protein
MKGDGDFRSAEVIKPRNESDIIITNPPFSLFREFFAWLMEANKKFIIIGNKNCITYKEVFPFFKKNKLWIGYGFNGGNAFFKTPYTENFADGVYNRETGLVKFRNVVWITNLDHGRRHKPLPLMTMADNLKFSKHKEIKRKKKYAKYDNNEAIEVPYTDAMPSDYNGIMGAPISFLDKYCPEQFEIMGMCENLDLYKLKTKVYTSEECRKAYFEKFGKQGAYDLNASGVVYKNDLLEKAYQRILIKRKGAKK